MELTKQQFIDRLTNAEFIGVLTAAKTDIEVEAWLFRFNNVVDTIDTADLRTIAGLSLLVAKGLLTQPRADEIAGTTASWSNWSIGQAVRVLAPFNAAYPATYTLIGIDPTAPSLTIEGGAQFDPRYIEAA